MKAEINQDDEQLKPRELRRELRLEHGIIVVASPDRLTDKEDDLGQGRNGQVFDRMAFFFTAVQFALLHIILGTMMRPFGHINQDLIPVLQFGSEGFDALEFSLGQIA